ncbi:hypothetical protein CEXT_166751 [Caerostris extrusa]|uniref:Uncharacterized protein n=1 Tax=Caerostris extrusa TaxID=172846 RepID=A0AAV4XXS6_CAEEX|nr:hypothetical protein CEXT_166751 [Caerostris extrusa]
MAIDCNPFLPPFCRALWWTMLLGVDLLIYSEISARLPAMTRKVSLFLFFVPMGQLKTTFWEVPRSLDVRAENEA